jgi:hypothetical protein
MQLNADTVAMIKAGDGYVLFLSTLFAITQRAVKIERGGGAWTTVDCSNQAYISVVQAASDTNVYNV